MDDNAGNRGGGRGRGAGVPPALNFSPGTGRGQLPVAGPGRGSLQSGLAGVNQPASPPMTSAPRPMTIHNDPFSELEQAANPGERVKGPPDPNRNPDRSTLVKVKPRPDPWRPPDGFGIYEPPKYKSVHPGITWHNGLMEKQNLNVFVRRITEDKLAPDFMVFIGNERAVLNSLKHKFILNIIGSYKAKGMNDENLTMTVFRQCDADLEKEEARKDMKLEKVPVYMGQVAQAVAYMHYKNYVHSSIHPSSLRKEGTRHVRLSRFLYASKWNPTKPGTSGIPNDPHEFFFIAPERFCQEIHYDSANVYAQEGIMPSFPNQWDGKHDDVWAFGCTTFFLLTGHYPFFERHADHREFLRAIKTDFLTQRITRYPGMADDARQFLLWILHKNPQERPTMVQIVNHPWLQTGSAEHVNPTSPHNAPHLSTKKKIRKKTFRMVPGFMSDDLVRQMTEKGYSIEYVIGQGSFGAVYKGMKVDKASGTRTPIAMKLIKRESSKTFRIHRWFTEYKIMTELKHPNIVEVYDVFKEIKRQQHKHSEEGRVFIFMELATMDLHTMIQNKGKIPEQELRPLMVQVVEGLIFLRQNKIAHRDIKPHNILICGPNGDIAKVTDYSLVRQADSHTISTSIVGTRAYMAPELHLKETITDVFKLDVFSLGITIYESLMGQRPNWDPDKGAKETFRLKNARPFLMEYVKMVQSINGCPASAEAKKLMKGMLDDKNKRFNWKQVKKHPWMTGTDGSAPPSPAPSSSGSPSSGPSRSPDSGIPAPRGASAGGAAGGKS